MRLVGTLTRDDLARAARCDTAAVRLAYTARAEGARITPSLAARRCGRPAGRFFARVYPKYTDSHTWCTVSVRWQTPHTGGSVLCLAGDKRSALLDSGHGRVIEFAMSVRHVSL